MKLINGNIEQLFKEKLFDFEANPSEKVWSNLETDLLNKKKKRLLPLFLKAAAIIILLGVGGLIIKISMKTEVPLQITEEIQIQSPTDETNKRSELLIEEVPANILSKLEIEKTPQTLENPVRFAPESEEERVIEQKTEETVTEINHNHIARTNDLLTRSEENITEIPQNLFEADIINAHLITESDAAIHGNLASKAVPVYQNPQINYISSIYAEETNSKKSRSLQWSLGGQAGPQYTYRDVVVADPASQNYNLDDYESGIITYAGGFNVQLGTSRRFTIQSGVYYSKLGTNKAEVFATNSASRANPYYDNISAESIFESAPSDIANSTGSFTFDKNYRQTPVQTEPELEIEYSKGENVVQEYFEYIEIPFVLRYKIIDRKLGIGLNGGLWTNFLIDMDATSTSSDAVNITEKPENINKISYSGSLGIGLDFPITSNILFNLEPIFKYYLSPINKDVETQVHPYSFGIMTGISYSF